MIDKDKLLANPSAPSNTPIVGNFFLKANRKLVSIHSLLKGSVALKKIKLRKQKKEEEDNQRQKTENRLEKRKSDSDKKSLMSSVKSPGGVLGWFKNFIGKTLLGFFAVKLLRFLPAIKNILPVVGGAISFLASTGLFLVDSIASFINFSYNVFDGAKGILKTIGGDNLEKTFGNFMGAIDNVINVLILGTLVRGLGGPFAFGRGRGIFGDAAAQAAGIKADGPSKKRRRTRARPGRRGRPGGTAGFTAGQTIGGYFGDRAKSKAQTKLDQKIEQERITRRQKEADDFLVRQRSLRDTIARRRSRDVLSKTRIADRLDEAFDTKLTRRSDLFRTDRARRAAEISFDLDESMIKSTGPVLTNDPDVNTVIKIRRIDDKIEKLQRGDFSGRLRPNVIDQINQLNLERGRLLKDLGVQDQTPLPFMRRMRSRFDPRGRDIEYFRQRDADKRFLDFKKFVESGEEDADIASKIFKGGARRSTQRAVLKTLGRDGVKAFKGLLRPIPLLGALLDFGLSVALGDPIPKALAKVAFAGVAGVIGGLGGLAAAPFLGPIAPLAPFIGAILAGVAGDLIAGSLYDMTLGKIPIPFFNTQTESSGGNPLAGIMNFFFPTEPASAAEVAAAGQDLIRTSPFEDGPAQVTPPGKSIFTGEFVLPESVAKDKAFMDGIDRLAEKYQVSPVDILSVMAFETGGSFDPAQKNLAGSGATGLIQFMPDTARGLGTTTQQLAGMTRAQQLKFVDRYFSNKGIQGGSLSDLYMGVLFPAAVGKPDSYILFGNNAAIPRFRGMGPRSAYVQNRGLDLNNDGSITKAEAAAKVEATKKRYAKFGDQSMNRSQGLDTQASYEKAQAPSTVVINKTTLVAMAGEQTTPSVSAPSVVSANPYSTLYAG